MALTRALRALMLGLILSVVLAAPVGAHHVMIMNSSPGTNARLASAPAELVADFDLDLAMPGSGVAVYDEAGMRRDRGEAMLMDKRMLHLPLPPLEPGTYRVVWGAMSTEHLDFTEGDFSFTVLPSLDLIRPDRWRLAALAMVVIVLGALSLLAGGAPARA